MRRAAHIVALHGALWGSDRWYRWSWYVGPAAMALLVVGWICIGKSTGATASAAAWGRPVSRQPIIRNLKVTPTQQPNWADLELVSCFANRPLASETACTRLIDERQVVGQRLAAVYTERGYLRREKDPARALIDYDSALRVQPGFVDALAGRAWINMTRGDYDAALPDLNKALDLSPTAGTARYYRGYAYLRLKDYAKALSDLDEAQKLQPSNADIYLARGEVEQAQANYDAALLDFESFSKRASKDPRGLIASGAVLEAMGRPQEALAAYESAVAIAPDNYDAIAGRDRLRAEQNGGDPSKKEDDKKENDQPK